MGRPVFSQHCWIWSKTRSLKASTVFSLSSLYNFPSSLCRTQSPSCCNTNIRLAFVFFTAAQKNHLSHFAPFILLKWAFPHILPPLLSYSLLLLSTVCLHVNVRSCLCIFPSMPHTSSLSSPVASWEGCVGAEAAVFFKPACYPKREDLRHKLICTWHVWVHWGPPNTSHLNKLQIEILM